MIGRCIPINALAKGQSGINFPVANDTLGIQPSTSVGSALYDNLAGTPEDSRTEAD